MAVWSIVKYSELGPSIRIDGDYYRPELLSIQNIIRKLPSHKLGQYIEQFDSGLNAEQVENQTEGYPFIRTQNVRPILLNYNGLSRCIEFPNDKLLKYGDILVVRVGEGVGNYSVVTNDFVNAAFSDNVIRIRLSKEVNPFFLITFLSSKFGRALSQKVKKGTARSLISKENIGDITIPFIEKNKMKIFQLLIDKANEQMILSRSLLSSAESLLLSELGLDKLDLPKTKWNVRNFSEARTEERIDGEYYSPKYYALIEAINKSKYGGTKLLDKVTHKSKMMKPKPERTYRYVELADVDQSLGTITETSEIVGKELPSRARMALKARDVVISSVEGSVDKATLIPDELDGAVGSTGFFVFEEREYTAELLLVLLRLGILKDQFIREARGTILTAVNQSSLDNIVVPEVPEPLMDEISAKVRKSHSAQKEAKELLVAAKKKVEEMIWDKR